MTLNMCKANSEASLTYGQVSTIAREVQCASARQCCSRKTI